MKKLIIISIMMIITATASADKWENKCETHCDDYGNCTTKCTYDDDPDDKGCFISIMN